MARTSEHVITVKVKADTSELEGALEVAEARVRWLQKQLRQLGKAGGGPKAATRETR